MSNFDISIVIPSYDEGRDIDRTLVRIAALTKKLSKSIRVAVFVVINNASGSTPHVKKNNHRTSTLLNEIKNKREGLKIRKRSKRDTKILQYLTRSRIKIIEVDLFRSRKAPKICNVGIARGVGFREASNQTKKNGVLVGTDADTLLGKDYLAQALLLRQEKRYGALTGPVKIYPGAVNIIDNQDMIDEIERLWLESINSPNTETMWDDATGRYIPHTPGSNLVVQNRVFKRTKGFPEVNGGEDILFGMHIGLQGEGIDYDEKLAVFTSPRVSLRTPEGHGFGQTMDKKSRALYDIDFAYLPSKKFTIVLQEVANFLLMNRDCWLKKDIWLKDITGIFNKFKIHIDQEKMERWYDMLLEFREFNGQFFHPLVRVEVVQELEQAFPPVSLAYGAEKVIDDSPHLDTQQRQELKSILCNARTSKLGCFVVKFILLYVKIITMMKELGIIMVRYEQVLKNCSTVFDYNNYFKIYETHLKNMMVFAIRPYALLLHFEYNEKLQGTARENGMEVVVSMTDQAKSGLIDIEDALACRAIQEVQKKIAEINMMIPKLYFDSRKLGIDLPEIAHFPRQDSIPSGDSCG